METGTVHGKVLIADDEVEITHQLAQLMCRQGLTPVIVSDGVAALDCIRSQHPDLLLVDFYMPGKNGLEVLRKAKSLDADLPVILITGQPELRGAIDGIRAGALDYITKPFEHEEVVRLVKRGLRERLSRSRAAGEPISLRELLGPSQAVSRLIADVECVANSNFSVILLGETGSGKEVLARTIHRLSGRSRGPFVPVDCGAIPESLVESELFGYERGAFTGADRQKCGRFETAHGGTLFLDELPNLPFASQAKLLRVLQDRALYRVGGATPIPVDARLLAASNLDFEQLVEAGKFRRDLYFRLNEFVIQIPPLRERREDIPYLAQQFLDRTNAELGKQVGGFTPGAVDDMLAYSWPGNIRQLRSVIRRAVLLAEDEVAERHLELHDQAPSHHVVPEADTSLSLREIIRRRTMCVEREVITETLRRAGGNKAKAARLLQVDYKTIHYKVKEYGIGTKGARLYGQQG